jgi:pimeloyl-ACP methyl ester carboxylesterase
MMSGHDFLDQQFPTLKMPMLIVWGREDHVIPLALAESMHRLAPQSQLSVYDGCGHIAPSACSQKIAPAVLTFLAAK